MFRIVVMLCWFVTSSFTGYAKSIPGLSGKHYIRQVDNSLVILNLGHGYIRKISGNTGHNLNIQTMFTVTGQGNIGYTSRKSTSGAEWSTTHATMFNGGFQHLWNTLLPLFYEKSVVMYLPESSNMTGKDRPIFLSSEPGDAPRKNAHSILVKVTAGDTLNMSICSWYDSEEGVKKRRNISLEEMALSMVGVIVKNPNKTSISAATAANPLATAILSLLRTRTPLTVANTHHTPKAYLNYMLLDENLKPIANNTTDLRKRQEYQGFIALSDRADIRQHTKNKWPIKKSGYAYIFTSNENQDINVHFDDLAVSLTTGSDTITSEYTAFKKYTYQTDDKSLPEQPDPGNSLSDLLLELFLGEQPENEIWTIPFRSPYLNTNRLTNLDLRGDSIFVCTDEGQRLFYAYNIKSGYGFYSTSSAIDTASGLPFTCWVLYCGKDIYVKMLSRALGRLMLGKFGRSLVKDLAYSEKSMIIQRTGSTNLTSGDGNGVLWNATSMDGSVNQYGSVKRPPFIGLGHELVHQTRIWNGTVDSSAWITRDPKGKLLDRPIVNDEKHATHGENKIRSENNIALVEYYSRIDTATRIINSKTRESVYFDSKERLFDTIIKKRIPYIY